MEVKMMVAGDSWRLWCMAHGGWIGGDNDNSCEINAAEPSDGCSSKNICQDGLEDNESMALSENEFVNENSDDGARDLAYFFRLDNSEDIGSICFEMLRRSEMIQFHFKSLDIAYEFYNEYARATGFSVRKNKSYYGSLGDVVWKSFVCSREGLRRENNKDIEDESGRESRAITRCGCKAEFRVRVDKSRGPWTEIHFEDKHNHEVFSDRFAGHLKSHNKMSEADIAEMNSMREVGIGMPKIFGLAGHLSRAYGNIGFKRKQMYNQLIKERRQQEGDAHATLRINAKEGLDQNVQQGGGCDLSNRLNRITSLKRCARRLFSIVGRSLEDYHEIRELLNANAGRLLSNNQSTVNVGESGRNCSDQHVKDPTRVRTKGCGTSVVVQGKKKKIRKCGSCRQDGHNIRSRPVEALKRNFTQTSEESEFEGVPYSEDDGV
ncbi:hypothetical protein RIF29_09125 [Crotalaria pallida]|uniref:FAR1 domain-containing protein n=1 Tax=Crotalaria pallida TaxID=3830 RepID=A0AAN9IHR0_CROPI